MVALADLCIIEDWTIGLGGGLRSPSANLIYFTDFNAADGGGAIISPSLKLLGSSSYDNTSYFINSSYVLYVKS